MTALLFFSILSQRNKTISHDPGSALYTLLAPWQPRRLALTLGVDTLCGIMGKLQMMQWAFKG